MKIMAVCFLWHFPSLRLLVEVPRYYLAACSWSPDFPRFSILEVLKRDRPADCSSNRNIYVEMTLPLKSLNVSYLALTLC